MALIFDGLDDMIAIYRAKGAGGKSVLREILEHAGEDGVEDMQHTIATTESALVPGKQNRIWTGQMHDEIYYELSEDKHSVTVRFGWLNPDFYEDYHLAQEYGLRHVHTGMFALMGAWVKQREEVFSVIQELTK